MAETSDVQVLKSLDFDLSCDWHDVNAQRCQVAAGWWFRCRCGEVSPVCEAHKAGMEADALRGDKFCCASCGRRSALHFLGKFVPVDLACGLL